MKLTFAVNSEVINDNTDSSVHFQYQNKPWKNNILLHVHMFFLYKTLDLFMHNIVATGGD